MLAFVLEERVLTDNMLLLAEKGKVFHGGYIAIVKEYKFQNSWSDRLEVKRFRKKEKLIQYLDKAYKEVVDDLDFTGTCIEG